MKLLVIRHGEPDYAKDCLTQNGIWQAERLAERLKSTDISAAYTSPMGRARQTAQIAMAGRSIPVTECAWLHEFDVKVAYEGKPIEIWDIPPNSWTQTTQYYDKDRFADVGAVAESEVKRRYEAVCSGIDSLLLKHGLERRGEIYHAVSEHDKTIVLFCHFGATCVIAAHLLGISPMVTLQGFSAEPTAIATFCTDDRFGDDVNFRLHGFGDISHTGSTATGTVNYK
ncbi:MAG: histidine phosphatase family protein [Ruminococcus sp.]|nr:histidine phosphatase family protein [Ruminococcus sp.]